MSQQIKDLIQYEFQWICYGGCGKVLCGIRLFLRRCLLIQMIIVFLRCQWLYYDRDEQPNVYFKLLYSVLIQTVSLYSSQLLNVLSQRIDATAYPSISNRIYVP